MIISFFVIREVWKRTSSLIQNDRRDRREIQIESNSHPHTHKTRDEPMTRHEMALLANIDVTDNDILCGRGRGLESFPGNKVFRGIIKQHAKVYGNPKTTRTERSRLVIMIANRLSVECMRFLKREARNWIIVEDRHAKMKVCL